MKNIFALLALIFTATFVVSPYFTSPFLGFSADQLPIPQINPPVQPEGYAFAIWGLIYSWLVVSAIFGLWKRSTDSDWDRVRKPLIVSLAAGTPWLAVANQSAIWATVLIFVMAAAALTAFIVVPTKDRWLLQAPVAIYAGWLTAAAFVSLGSTAAGYGLWMGSLGWAYACIGLALIVSIAMQRFVPRAPEYGATVIWALIGIMVTNGTVTLGVTLTAAVGIALIGIVAVTGLRSATA